MGDFININGVNAQTRADGISQVVVPKEHALIHAGAVFFATVKFTSVAASGVSYVQITTPASPLVHLKGVVAATTKAYLSVSIYEGGTSTGGTAVTARNRNRASSAAATCTIVHTPTTPSPTTLLETFVSASDVDGLGGDMELVLAPSTKYFITLTNGDAVAADLSVQLLWYEEA